MLVLRKKNFIMITLVVIFVIIPIILINNGDYNFSNSLTKVEEREYLQVIYSLCASMVFILYYGVKWLLYKSNGIFLCITIFNILGITSLVLLYETMQYNLLMEADYYYLIVYTELVIVLVMQHVYSKTS
jgi:hypothetical protein